MTGKSHSPSLAARQRAGLGLILASLMLALPVAAQENASAPPARERAEIADGVAITPEFARQVFNQIGALHAGDGCTLVRFDTSRFRFVIGLQAPSGGVHILEAATAPLFDRDARPAGSWALSVPPELERECGATLTAIEKVLGKTDAPTGAGWALVMGQTNYGVLTACFALLVLGTLWILAREAFTHREAWPAMLALGVITALALALRLWLSPRTFLHEYYHIAETVSGYLSGNLGPTYGKTGPAMFRLVATLLGRPDGVGVIFLTNACFAALAIPAVALFDLALLRNWPRALLAAALLCVLPQHLRFSASEVLFIQAITFGFWALALFALYLSTQRLSDAVCAALATALAMQARPEMLFFPALPIGLLLLTQPRSWRVLLGWRSLLAFALLALLLVPRFLDLFAALGRDPAPTPMAPDLSRFVSHLVLFDERVTPALYWVFFAVGLLWGLWRAPGFMLWVAFVVCGFSFFSLTLFDNGPYNLRSQLLPNCFAVLIGAGVAPLWMAIWGTRRRQAARAGAGLLAVLAIALVARSHAFITELRDQQLEFAFLDRSVARLPARGRLLSTIEMGGSNLDAFPDFLLRRENKHYQLIDVRRVFAGAAAWPPPGPDLIFYQGMFCYFSLDPKVPVDPMTPLCAAVHQHYELEPLLVEELDAKGYSELAYARGGNGPYRIGFFRLQAPRGAEATP